MTTLIYRGIQFENASPAVETADLAVFGTYRGRKASFSRSAVSPAKSGATMQFLGKRYTA